MKHSLVKAIAGVLVALPCQAGPFDDPECIAGAKPGGGFDLTCRLVQTMLSESKAIPAPVRLVHVPGGIGAVAFNAVVARKPASPGSLVAFSSGSLLLLAQGKFGPYSEHDVRWVATIGADYGAIVVARDSPIRTLRDLELQLRRDPSKVIFGGGGAVGSQDWMKSALTARALGLDFKGIRFVAFEGGGEALTALLGGHVTVFAGDVAETQQKINAGAPLRIVAVLAPERLPGKLSAVPTALEQGYDIRWRSVRGVYIGPKVSDADYDAWVEAFRKAASTTGLIRGLEQRGLSPFVLTGPELERFVASEMANYRALARQFGLRLADARTPANADPRQ
jgi:putative tricarboxylic transport membrane protein